jgi:CheY-like chemotaxis protein
MAARVLVIEDDLISQDIIKSGLEAHGFEVDVAGDGFSAVRLLKEGRHDVALVDYQLPELDGYASARLLRELTDSGAPKLIAITANANALMARPNAGDLFEAVLNKPLELPSLVRMIETSLNDPRRRRLIDEAARLWRERGLSRRPRAKVIPEPTREQALTLGVCFELVDWSGADIILLADRQAAPSVNELRSASDAFLLPVVVLDDRMKNVADAAFQISSPQAWNELAATILRFEQNRRRLSDKYHRPSSLDERLLGYLFLAERMFAPVSDPSQPSCVRYPGFFPETETVIAAERLANRGLLERRFVDRFHACSACQSHRLNVREECPKCRSPNLNEMALLHHFACAYQGPEDDFRSDTHLVCPKCRQNLRHYGGDYDRPGSVLKCGECAAWNSDPAIGFSCLDCGGHMDGDAAPKRDLFGYGLSDRAREALAVQTLRIGANASIAARQASPSTEAGELAVLEVESARMALEELAVIEVQYNSQPKIVSRDGQKVFATLRRLFIQNITDLLAEYGHVLTTADRDYIVVGGNDQASLPEFVAGLLARCQENLGRDLAPSYRILDADEIAAAA